MSKIHLRLLTVLTALILVGLPAESQAFSVAQAIKSEAKQLDEIQDQIRANKKKLEALESKVSAVQKSVGVGRVSFQQKTLYDLVVGIYQCVRFGCQT